MALPFIGLIILVAISIISFFFGFSRENVNAGFAFIVFSGIILLSTSMFVMNEGLELNQVDEYIDNATGVSVEYTTVSYSIDSWNWLRVVVDTMFWSAPILFIIGFVLSVQKTRANRVDEWAV